MRGATDCVFLCLRCRRASSLFSLIRIDFLPAVESSTSSSDLDLVCLMVLWDVRLVRGLVASRSDSEAAEDEPDDTEGRGRAVLERRRGRGPSGGPSFSSMANSEYLVEDMAARASTSYHA